jgi:hypothetical protein
MASIYLNGSYYWISLSHLLNGLRHRLSLETGSRARAELLKRKWEAWIEFNQPELEGVEFPGSLRALLPASEKDGELSAAESKNAGSIARRDDCRIAAR